MFIYHKTLSHYGMAEYCQTPGGNSLIPRKKTQKLFLSSKVNQPVFK